VLSEVGVAMDIFPTFLKAAGGDITEYELDGLDIMPEITAQLTAAAQSWRNKIEERWKNYWLPRHGRSTDWW